VSEELKEPEFEKSKYQKLLIFVLLNFLLLPFIISFFNMDEEKQNEKLKTASMEIMTRMDIRKCFDNKNINYPPEKCDILAFKKEEVLEVWAGSDSSKQLIKSYKFTAFSGTLGPKLREGDLQIPEGEYKIAYLNPESKYHLSICLNYPNEFDLAMAGKDGRTNPGSDICIHGKNVTIGCIPIGDKAIEEVYNLVESVDREKVRVLIFPNDAREGGHFEECPDCPVWTDSLYSNLKVRLDNYTK